MLQDALRKQGLPSQKISGSPLLADVIRQMGFKKAEDFYIALGSEKISARIAANKVMQLLKQGESAEGEPTAAEIVSPTRDERRRPNRTASQYGIAVEGVDDVMIRMAKCCRPVPGDPILGYISLGRGITIHRDDCPNVVALKRNPDRFTEVSWEGNAETAYKVEVQVHGWDRHRLLEDLSRAFAEVGINILEAQCVTSHPMVKNRFVVEVPDTQSLKGAITRIRTIDGVFDAYRVTPGSG